MGVKRVNLKLISGLLLPSFILNYILIRVKERGLESENLKAQEREKTNEQGEKKNKALGICLLDH